MWNLLHQHVSSKWHEIVQGETEYLSRLSFCIWRSHTLSVGLLVLVAESRPSTSLWEKQVGHWSEMQSMLSVQCLSFFLRPFLIIELHPTHTEQKHRALSSTLHSSLLHSHSVGWFSLSLSLVVVVVVAVCLSVVTSYRPGRDRRLDNPRRRAYGDAYAGDALAVGSPCCC